MLKTVDRYLLWETCKPLIFCIFALTLIMIGGQLFELTDLIIIKQVPTIKVAELLLYRIPQIMVETFTVSVLFATLLALGRLVQTNEYTAIRMGGLNLTRILIPFFAVALTVSGLSFIANEHIVPWTNHRAQNIVREALLKEPGLALEEDVFFTGGGDRFFYVGELDEKNQRLHRVVIFSFGENRDYPQLISAPRGSYSDELWNLEEGMIYRMTSRGRIEDEVSFGNLELNVGERIQQLYGRQRTPSEMSRGELRSQIDIFQKSGIEVSSLLVEYHLKLALPLASFIFVLIGAPLSLFSRKGRVFGIIASLVILFLYYILLSVSRSLGRNNLIHPLWAAWLPNIVFAAAGCLLIFHHEYLNFRFK